MGKYLDREGVRHLWKKAVGMFATKATATTSSDGLMSAEDKQRVNAALLSLERPAGADLNTMVTPGHYYGRRADVANAPAGVSGTHFGMAVVRLGPPSVATATVLQVVRAANKYVMGTVYYREVAYNTSPGKWYKVDMSKISAIATT